MLRLSYALHTHCVTLLEMELVASAKLRALSVSPSTSTSFFFISTFRFHSVEQHPRVLVALWLRKPQSVVNTSTIGLLHKNGWRVLLGGRDFGEILHLCIAELKSACEHRCWLSLAWLCVAFGFLA